MLFFSTYSYLKGLVLKNELSIKLIRKWMSFLMKEKIRNYQVVLLVLLGRVELPLGSREIVFERRKTENFPFCLTPAQLRLLTTDTVFIFGNTIPFFQRLGLTLGDLLIYKACFYSRLIKMFKYVFCSN